MNQNMTANRWLFCWMVSLFSMQIYGYLDHRPLVDLGRYYQAIPDWWVFFDTWNLQMLGSLSTQFAGWLNAVLAFCTWVGGEPEVVFAGYTILTSGLFWWSVRHETTLSLVCVLMQPIWQVGWRTHWIHALETSLLLMVWQGCRRNQSRIWIGFLSMLAVWLRPSAIIWLTILWGWSLKCRTGERNAIQGIPLGMLLGMMVIWPNLMAYIVGKTAVPRIEMDWLDQISRHGGLIPTVLMLCIWLFRGVRNLNHEDWLYCVWIVLGLILAMGFGVGLDNFPLFFLGLALFCGHKNTLKWVQWSAVSICAVLNVLPFVPLVPKGLSVVVHPNMVNDTLFDFQRPIRQVDGSLNVQHVMTILEEVCPTDDRHCIVVTTGSLFHPHRESSGRLALLNPSLKHVRIEKSELWYRRPQQMFAVNVAILHECVEPSDVWPMHFRQTAVDFSDRVRTWVPKDRLTSESCSWTFFVPPRSQETR
jgi:hypothetical protein